MAGVEQEDDEISAKQAADILGVGLTTMYEYADAGDLAWRNAAPGSKRRRRYRFQRRDVVALKSRQSRKARQTP